VENSLWKRLWTSCKTDYGMINELFCQILTVVTRYRTEHIHPLCGIMHSLQVHTCSYHWVRWLSSSNLFKHKYDNCEFFSLLNSVGINRNKIHTRMEFPFPQQLWNVGGISVRILVLVHQIKIPRPAKSVHPIMHDKIRGWLLAHPVGGGGVMNRFHTKGWNTWEGVQNKTLS
jgi:hypothetical protein